MEWISTKIRNQVFLFKSNLLKEDIIKMDKAKTIYLIPIFEEKIIKS